MKLPFKTGQNITRQESPRVLILPPWRWSREFTDDLAERLAATVPTVLVASSLSQENLSEWDCLITGQDPGAVDLVTLEPANYRGEPQSEWQWHQRYPPQLSLICLVEHGNSLEPLDVWPPEGGRPRSRLLLSWLNTILLEGTSATSKVCRRAWTT